MKQTQWLEKFILQRQKRFSAVKRKETLTWELAFEIILGIDVILFKCNYNMGDMLREKLKYKNDAEVIKRRLISSSGVNG